MTGVLMNYTITVNINSLQLSQVISQIYAVMSACCFVCWYMETCVTSGITTCLLITARTVVVLMSSDKL